MSEQSSATDSLSQRHSFVIFWEAAGLALCVLMVFGVAWWDWQTSFFGVEKNKTEPMIMTVSSMEAVRCKMKNVLSERTVFGSGILEKQENFRSDGCSPAFRPILVENLRRDAFTDRLYETLRGTPMERTAGLFSRYDRSVAAFAVGIAKKESDLGRHAPHLAGEDCFNYWGYKGRGGRGSVGSYACFVSPEEAMDAVVGKISQLVNEHHRDTPAKMVVWKCGSSCSWDNPTNVTKWINEVGAYYHRLVTG